MKRRKQDQRKGKRKEREIKSNSGKNHRIKPVYVLLFLYVCCRSILESSGGSMIATLKSHTYAKFPMVTIIQLSI